MNTTNEEITVTGESLKVKSLSKQSVNDRFNEKFFVVNIKTSYNEKMYIFSKDETTIEDVYKAINTYNELERNGEYDEDFVVYLDELGINYSEFSFY